MTVEVRGLRLIAGEFQRGPLDFVIEQGRYGVLMGRTGCGKTTLLETICGLRPPDAGSVWIAGADVTHQRAAERGIGYVPQDAALFPTMTVGEQLGFALQIRGQGKAVMRERVAELAESLGIEPLMDRLPAGLSGGERQRVALGRALSFRPRVLLLDEPLAALDDATRDELHGVLARVQRETAVTVLHVTHHRADAEALADVVYWFGDTIAKTTLALERPDLG